jgi:glycosyltransferase involved in cell wall biosynthesis
MKKKEITVSVCTITYKHAEFIKETIDGVLMQEVDFPIEFIIADDNSPDNTEEIVRDYIQNHPKGGLIKYTKHSTNKGMMGNFIWALEQCKGKYIALCDGDDYWTDPKKLEKQVSVLEENENLAICSHRIKVLSDDDTRAFNSRRLTGEIELENELFNHPLHTCSVVFRNKIEHILPKLTNKKLLSGDRLLLSQLMLFNNAYVLEDSMAVHIRHQGGISQSKTNRDLINFSYNEIVIFSSVYNAIPKSGLKYKIKEKLASLYFGLFYKKMKKLQPDFLMYLFRANKYVFGYPLRKNIK